jgi:hypothetical protein
MSKSSEKQQQVMTGLGTYKVAFGRKHNAPKLVVLWALLRYIDPALRKLLLQDMRSRKRLSDIQLLDHVKQAVDIERLRTEALQWQDIWVYNYLLYEFKGKFNRSLLLGRYHREVFLKDGGATPEFVDELKAWMMVGS